MLERASEMVRNLVTQQPDSSSCFKASASAKGKANKHVQSCNACALRTVAWTLQRTRTRPYCQQPLSPASLAGVAEDDSFHTPLNRPVVPAQQHVSARLHR